MSHVFFFSYAHANKDKELERFFEDLCEEVKVYTTYAAKDHRLSFRDGNNLPLMEEWRPQILEALQTSAVIVCATSPAYFGSRFCGQEYYIFDQRRRSMPGGILPPVILPIIWVPDPMAPPNVLDLVQWNQGEMDTRYQTKGLRYLMKRDPNEYDRCVTLFGEAIGREWQAQRNLLQIECLASFTDIPNAFIRTDWHEAASPQGWLPGPRVANFVFAASVSKHFPAPPGRYGPTPSEWRPYFPPEPHTVSDLAHKATRHQSLLYRELPIDEHISTELTSACERKNLTLVVADVRTLSHCAPIDAFDRENWHGTAVLVPWAEGTGAWEEHRGALSRTFPIRSQANTPPFRAPIGTKLEFEQQLELTLTDLQTAVINSGAGRRQKIDGSEREFDGMPIFMRPS
jgi:FxsC-like protein